MKKIAWAFALVAPLALASCSSDEEGVSLDRSSLDLNYKATATLTPSEKNGNWSSDNEFVATVNKDGEVTAKHVGQAKITYSTSNGSATCVVKVSPTDNKFMLPILNWGASFSTIQSLTSDAYFAFDATNSSEQNGQLYFDTKPEAANAGLAVYGNGMPWYLYRFANDEMASASITVPLDETVFNDFLDWLEQYYANYDPSLEDLYGNGLTSATSDIKVEIQYPEGDIEVMTAVWVNTGTRANAASEVAAHKAAIEAKLAK